MEGHLQWCHNTAVVYSLLTLFVTELCKHWKFEWSALCQLAAIVIDVRCAADAILPSVQ